jgi:hypothetical protein
MMDFKEFAKAISVQFEKMSKTGLYRSSITKDAIWDLYLASFPEGTNPINKTRTEYDCRSCRSFMRAAGTIVTIVDNKLVTLWDIEIGGEYQIVCNALSEAIKKLPIDNIYLNTEATAGVRKNYQLLAGALTIEWNHFFITLPKENVRKEIDIGPQLSVSRSTKDVFFRGLNELTIEACNTVLELIAQNSLYRGSEFNPIVQSFSILKLQFDKLSNEKKELFAWQKVKESYAVTRIRSSAIGTLLIDLSEGKDLDVAVRSFESVVAPSNYKRPTALVTKAMIQKAQEKIEELGFGQSLYRRFANINDITINNILFANRTAKKQMNVFDELASKVPENFKTLDRIEEVSIETFLSQILPKASSIEVMLENQHVPNLVSLIAPEDPTSKGMFKWPNKFSWSYNGGLTDSMKEKVKAAGGKVDGYIRCSLSWFNYDDLDLAMYEPNSHRIYFGDKLSSVTRGQLDVDMNAGRGMSKTPVENIVYPDKSRVMEGKYKLVVNQFSQRSKEDVGFEAEIECDGVVHHFSWPKALATRETVTVAKFYYSKKDGLTISESIPSSKNSKNVWNVATNVFHKVNVVMLSPNFWDGLEIGNKHYFFMLENCLAEGQARGFYNEFFIPELNEHRKVFEMVGAKMKTEESDKQLSGIGFSSTQRNSVLCRVKGTFNRIVKIVF